MRTMVCEAFDENGVRGAVLAVFCEHPVEETAMSSVMPDVERFLRERTNLGSAIGFVLPNISHPRLQALVRAFEKLRRHCTEWGTRYGKPVWGDSVDCRTPEGRLHRRYSIRFRTNGRGNAPQGQGAKEPSSPPSWSDPLRDAEAWGGF